LLGPWLNPNVILARFGAKAQSALYKEDKKTCIDLMIHDACGAESLRGTGATSQHFVHSSNAAALRAPQPLFHQLALAQQEARQPV